MARVPPPNPIGLRVTARLWREEIAATFALSWPIVLTNLANHLMTTTDVMMMGWYSPEALAAGTLGFNLYLPPFLFAIGVVGAVAPIAAARLGADAGDREGVRRVAHASFALSLALAAPIMAALWNTEAILTALGEPPLLARMAERYMHGLEWALFPNLLFFAARSLFAALDRVAPILICALLGLACNALANYALVFGNLGAPRLDVLGSGLSTTLSQTLMFVALALFVRLDARLKRARLFALPWRFDAQVFAEIWRLGFPIGLTIVMEVGIFSYSALAMGLISPTAIEAHAIVLQLAAIAFMVPLGLGQAASVRVGYFFGARDKAGVARAGWAAFALAICFVSLSATTMFVAPDWLLAPFLRGSSSQHAALAALALSFLRIAAIFQIFDGAQAALANMLRGAHDSRVPAIMALCGYWLIGAPLGFVLAFHTSLAGLGLWIGLAAGLACVAAMLLARWLWRLRRGVFV